VLTAVNSQWYFSRTSSLGISADHSSTHPTMVSPECPRPEFLLAKGAFRHIGIVLPRHHRLLNELPLVPLPSERRYRG
jgi:hypothetical protein